MSRVQLVEIDLRAITSAEELHSLLMESLNLPGWPQFSQRLPREAVLLIECLTEMQGEYPQLASKVIYA